MLSWEGDGNDVWEGGGESEVGWWWGGFGEEFGGGVSWRSQGRGPIGILWGVWVGGRGERALRY